MSFNSFSQHTSSFSSTPPSSSPHIKSDASASSSFAFLVHSQETLPNNLPPSVDNKSLARQRRRRTSPEDQSILEAEFQKNDRPSRDERARIVERVALGEKEIQIWFQNRRQLARRRSRPLQPHELFPHLHQATPGSALPDTPQIEKNDAALALERANASLARPTLPRSSSAPSIDSLKDTVATQATQETLIKQDSGVPSLQPGQSQMSAISYDGADDNENACNAGDARVMCDPVDPPSSPTIPASSQGSQQETLRPRSANAVADRQKAKLRLSMSSMGIAKILRDDESSPSPPRPLSVNLFSDPTFRSISQSFSGRQLPESVDDVPSNPLASSLGVNRGHRQSASSQRQGRSRDSRAWEFWCDPDAGQALNKQAEEESRGSAQDAIRLIRESSRRSALTSGPSGANAQGSDARPILKRSKSGVHSSEPKPKRQSLSRSLTSTGRLQRPRDSGIGMEVFVDDDCIKSATSPDKDSHVVNDGDSDKENVDPEARTQSINRSETHSHRRFPSGASQAGLSSRGAKYRGPAALQTRVNTGNSHSYRRARLPQQNATGRENADPETDPEIASFMGAGAKGTSRAGKVGAIDPQSARSEEDDMDCVQGLLSLSQGAWR